MNIFVAKLNYDTEENSLRNIFEQFGDVDTVKIISDKFSGRSKGFGFVEMPNDSEANAAIGQLNETELDGRTIVVKKAKPKEEGGSGEYRRREGGGGERNNRYQSRY
jgi:RNA recognition motif-containing protein